MGSQMNNDLDKLDCRGKNDVYICTGCQNLRTHDDIQSVGYTCPCGNVFQLIQIPHNPADNFRNNVDKIRKANKNDPMRYLYNMLAAFYSGEELQIRELKTTDWMKNGICCIKFASEETEIQTNDKLSHLLSVISRSYGFNDISERIRIKPKLKTAPLTSDDIPPVCWIRHPIEGSARKYLITFINKGYVAIAMHKNVSYTNLCIECWEMSTDLKTWKPCSKEIEE